MKKKLKKFCKLYLLNFLSIFFYIFRIFKIKNNKILVTNFRGKGYGDNPKYIVGKLLNEKKMTYDIVWAVKDLNTSLPNNVRKVKIYSLKYFYEFVTSKILINNSRFPIFVRKRKKQFYIQTWHSPLRLKHIELDIGSNIDPYYLKVIKNDSKMIDLMICGCDFSYNMYRNSFDYDGKILKIGTPRCDIFKDISICKDMRKKICQKYDICEDKKIILYAPTFRNSNNNEAFLDFNNIIEEYNLDSYVFLVRFHPNTKMSIVENDYIKNASNYSDMQELICSCDCLITDYSSCCFDAMYAGKKCILYLKDLEEYKLKNRDLYFDIEELPFIKTFNVEELFNNLKSDDLFYYSKNVDSFFNKIGNYEDGKSSEKIVDIIKKEIGV